VATRNAGASGDARNSHFIVQWCGWVNSRFGFMSNVGLGRDGECCGWLHISGFTHVDEGS